MSLIKGSEKCASGAVKLEPCGPNLANSFGEIAFPRLYHRTLWEKGLILIEPSARLLAISGGGFEFSCSHKGKSRCRVLKGSRKSVSRAWRVQRLCFVVPNQSVPGRSKALQGVPGRSMAFEGVPKRSRALLGVPLQAAPRCKQARKSRTLPPPVPEFRTPMSIGGALAKFQPSLAYPSHIFGRGP